MNIQHAAHARKNTRTHTKGDAVLSGRLCHLPPLSWERAAVAGGGDVQSSGNVKMSLAILMATMSGGSATERALTAGMSS